MIRALLFGPLITVFASAANLKAQGAAKIGPQVSGAGTAHIHPATNLKPANGFQDPAGQVWTQNPADPSHLSLVCSHQGPVLPWPQQNGPEISQGNCVQAPPQGMMVVPPNMQPVAATPQNVQTPILPFSNFNPFSASNNGGYGKGGNYDGGAPYGSSEYSPRPISRADMQSALASMRTEGLQPACGSGEQGTDMWTSTESVMKEGIIPPGQGKSLGAANRSRLVLQNGKLAVEFGPGKNSHCSSAVHAAFHKHIAELVNSGQMSLGDNDAEVQARLKFLNGPMITNALFGNTAAYAMLNTALGGQNMVAHRTRDIASVLEHARPGDVLKFDRNDNTGHQTVFKSFDGNKVCFWSSNAINGGVGVNCERISTLQNAVISRFPTDVQDIPNRLDKMKNSSAMGKFFATANVGIPISAIQTSPTLDCKPTSQQHSKGQGKATQ